MSGEGWLGISTSPASSGSAFTLSPSSPATLNVQPASLPALKDPSDDGARVHRAAGVLLFDNGSQTVNVLFVVVNPASASSTGYSILSASPSAAVCTPTALKAIHRSLATNAGAGVGWLGVIEVQVVDDCGNAVPDAVVVATFDDGSPPLNLRSLKNGIYSDIWRSSGKSAYVTVMVRANKAPLLAAEVTVTVAVPDTSSQVSINRGGVINAASFAPRQPVAAGSTISLYGRNLASGIGVANTTPLPTSLGGTSIMVAGKLLPLWFVSDGQVNAQLPYDLGVNVELQAIATGPNAISVPEPITIAPARPGIFSIDNSGTGQGHVYNALTYVKADAANPAKAGDYLMVYCTGLGQTDTPVASGDRAPLDRLVKVTIDVTATIGGVPAAVAFAGLAPGLVGLYQVNVVVPSGVAPGSAVPLVLTQNGADSNTVTLAIR